MLPWLIARSSGIVAFLLLAGAMVAGLLVRSRERVPGAPPAQMIALHQHLSVLALAAVGVHGAALVADRFVDVSPLALIVPGLVPYRPIWTALGVIAVQALIVVQVSSRVRRRIGVRVWRRLHLLAYAVFALAVAHGIGAGTDTARPWILATYAGAVGAVATLTVWRVITGRRKAPARRSVRKNGGVIETMADGASP